MKKLEIKDIFQTVSNISIERDNNTQSLLNINNRRRTSIFPWRGQFSPQLIEHILAENARPGYSILDPFCGSGTTLYESARLQLSCYGVDVNPAAYLFSSMVIFLNISSDKRKNILRKICHISRRTIADLQDLNPLSLIKKNSLNFTDRLFDFYIESQESFFTHLLATVSIMLAMGNSDTTNPKKFFKSFNLLLDTIQSLPYSKNECWALLKDTRFLEIPDSYIDLVITSPPYINVFNYHQNYRKALEFLGWQPLEVAVSEIGANRKHRSNRFLTAIQYCMDMCNAFIEMRRVLNKQGKVIIIVGRTSSIRGVSFQNSLLLGMVATGCAGFTVERWQERFFTNRFGEIIYEDILTLLPTENINLEYLEIARSIGVWALESSIEQTEGEIRRDIKKAIDTSFVIQTSPKLNIQIPPAYSSFYQSVLTNGKKQS